MLREAGDRGSKIFDCPTVSGKSHSVREVQMFFYIWIFLVTPVEFSFMQNVEWGFLRAWLYPSAYPNWVGLIQEQ